MKIKFCLFGKVIDDNLACEWSIWNEMSIYFIRVLNFTAPDALNHKSRLNKLWITYVYSITRISMCNFGK